MWEKEGAKGGKMREFRPLEADKHRAAAETDQRRWGGAEGGMV